MKNLWVGLTAFLTIFFMGNVLSEEIPELNSSKETTAAVKKKSAKKKKSKKEKKNIYNPAIFPRTPKQIDKEVNAILNRKPQEGFSAEENESVNYLNVYRYLSGLNYNTILDKEFCKQAQKAAEKCKSQGRLSHDFGDFTNVCNLSQGKSKMVEQVRVFIDDFGENNRKERGHRRNCFDPNLGVVGFGQSAEFGAMRCFGNGKNTQPQQHSYSYPGKGFFPQKYLHTTGWSYHVVGRKIADDVKVEMWLLKSIPKTMPSLDTKVKAPKVEVRGVFNHGGYVVWEPVVTSQGVGAIYWIRITSSTYSDQYAVVIY